MTETESSSIKNSVSNQIDTVRKNIENELKKLKDTLQKESSEVSSTSKTKIDNLSNFLKSEILNIKKELQSSIVETESQNVEHLVSLKESLNGQIDSLRGYANQLVEDEEYRLVNTLETSLTNVGDLTKDHSNKIDGIVKKVISVTDSSSSSPIGIVEDNNKLLTSDLNELLELEREKLSKSLVTLQIEFQDQISTQIEKVFMGVTVTKESLNGIIRDTLSRLEENLNRLNEGLDENFTNEIGATQDLIHTYEGKLLQTIEETKSLYDSSMKDILKRNNDSLLVSLDNLKNELSKKKDNLVVEIEGLNSEQKGLLEVTLNELEGYVVQSKAQVIESHGILKDDLEKLLSKNSESINELIDKMRSGNSEKFNLMNETVEDSTKNLQKNVEVRINEDRKEIESLLDQLKRESTTSVETTMKETTQSLDIIKKEVK